MATLKLVSSDLNNESVPLLHDFDFEREEALKYSGAYLALFNRSKASAEEAVKAIVYENPRHYDSNVKIFQQHLEEMRSHGLNAGLSETEVDEAKKDLFRKFYSMFLEEGKKLYEVLGKLYLIKGRIDDEDYINYLTSIAEAAGISSGQIQDDRAKLREFAMAIADQELMGSLHEEWLMLNLLRSS
jgi:hypothetical protein